MDIEHLTGETLGNYKIESLLGMGGMGVVYKARQMSLNRAIALKVLPPKLSSDPVLVKRFQREARAVAMLNHPNIVQIHDIGEDQGLQFFSMEYVEGRALDTILEHKGTMDADEAIKIVTQAGHALEHAHNSNIIHRDVKTGNILIGSNGNVKVTDFGLARIIDEHSELTQTGSLMGTPDFMSPEQCRGEELDLRTDIYSLGVVLYEMLTGRPPFEAPTGAALIFKIINDVPAEAISINPVVPEGLNYVVKKAMAKDRQGRYQSIYEFLLDLSNYENIEVPARSEPKKRFVTFNRIKILGSRRFLTAYFVIIGASLVFVVATREGSVNRLKKLADLPFLAGIRNETSPDPGKTNPDNGKLHFYPGEVRPILEPIGVAITEVDHQSRKGTLSYAASSGDDTQLLLLLADGVDVNTTDEFGKTALMWAALNGHTETMKILIKKGADVNVHSNSGETALLHAIHNGHTEAVQVLIEEGAEINAGTDLGTTPLMRAAANGKIKIINLLLKHGADVNAKMDSGQTALMLADFYNHKDVIEILEKAGAEQ